MTRFLSIDCYDDSRLSWQVEVWPHLEGARPWFDAVRWIIEPYVLWVVTFTLLVCTITASKVGRAGVEAPTRPDQCQPSTEVNMAVASVPAPSREVKIPNGDQGVTYREVVGSPGYAIGDDGGLWTCWRSTGHGPGGGSHAVISDRWRRLKPTPLKSGHLDASLYLNGKRRHVYVHRLVLEAFVGPCPSGMEACHDPDPTPSNCRLSNLRWDTHKANGLDTAKHGHTPRGTKNRHAKFTPAQIREMRRQRHDGVAPAVIAASFFTSRGYVYEITSGNGNWDWLDA